MSENLTGDFTKYLHDQLLDDECAVEYIKATCTNDVGLSETEFNRSIKNALDDLVLSRTSQLRTDLDTAVKALEEVQNPIKYMQQRLKEGERLDGVWAVKLQDDPNYLKDIAREALAKIGKEKG